VDTKNYPIPEIPSRNALRLCSARTAPTPDSTCSPSVDLNVNASNPFLSLSLSLYNFQHSLFVSTKPREMKVKYVRKRMHLPPPPVRRAASSMQCRRDVVINASGPRLPYKWEREEPARNFPSRATLKQEACLLNQAENLIDFEISIRPVVGR
jgi:hypothetical protein